MSLKKALRCNLFKSGRLNLCFLPKSLRFPAFLLSFTFTINLHFAIMKKIKAEENVWIFQHL